MLGEYVSKYYIPASRQGRRYAENGHETAKAVSAWKAKVRAAWSGVSARRLDTPRTRIQFGESIPVEVAVKLNGLAPGDVCVELLLSRSAREGTPVQHAHELTEAGALADGEHRFKVEMKPGLAGRLDYRVRIYPRNDLLTHPFETGLCAWL
jgi:glycogen phosphorylase